MIGHVVLTIILFVLKVALVVGIVLFIGGGLKDIFDSQHRD